MSTTTRSMTASEARSFDRYSVGNAASVMTALSCGCQPYQDVFTYNRWRAQGFQVQRGQKAIKLPVIITREVEGQDSEEARYIKLLRTTAVFCRHQVAPITAGAAPATRPGVTPPVQPHPSDISGKVSLQPAPGPRPQPQPAQNDFTSSVMKSWQEV